MDVGGEREIDNTDFRIQFTSSKSGVTREIEEPETYDVERDRNTETSALDVGSFVDRRRGVGGYTIYTSSASWWWCDDIVVGRRRTTDCASIFVPSRKGGSGNRWGIITMDTCRQYSTPRKRERERVPVRRDEAGLYVTFKSGAGPFSCLVRTQHCENAYDDDDYYTKVIYQPKDDNYYVLCVFDTQRTSYSCPAGNFLSFTFFFFVPSFAGYKVMCVHNTLARRFYSFYDWDAPTARALFYQKSSPPQQRLGGSHRVNIILQRFFFFFFC